MELHAYYEKLAYECTKFRENVEGVTPFSSGQKEL